MSVINQMLKDLEDRQQPESSEPVSSGQAVYVQRPAKKNNWLLITLLFLIFIVLTVISWQMFTSRGQTQDVLTDPVNKIQSNSEQVQTTATGEVTGRQVSSDANDEESRQVVTSSVASERFETRQTSEPEPVANEKTVAAAKVNSAINEETPPSNPISETVNPEAINPKPINPETPGVTQVIENEDPEPEPLQAKTSQDQQITRQNNEQNETPANAGSFVIEKSTVRLTLEQRVEQLLDEARLSFDKGYITEAVDKLQQLLRISDEHEEARNLLAGAWYGRGEVNRAVNVLNDGLKRYPRVEVWRLTAAKIFFKENNPAGAFSYLDIGLNGASKEFYSMKGSLARQLKQFAKAELAYTKLIEIEPAAGTWWLGLAIAQDSQGKQLDALRSYQQVLNTGGVSSDSFEFVQQRITQLQG